MTERRLRTTEGWWRPATALAQCAAVLHTGERGPCDVLPGDTLCHGHRRAEQLKVPRRLDATTRQIRTLVAVNGPEQRRRHEQYLGEERQSRRERWRARRRAERGRGGPGRRRPRKRRRGPRSTSRRGRRAGCAAAPSSRGAPPGQYQAARADGPMPGVLDLTTAAGWTAPNDHPAGSAPDAAISALEFLESRARIVRARARTPPAPRPGACRESRVSVSAATVRA